MKRLSLILVSLLSVVIPASLSAAVPTNVVIHPDAPGGNPSAPNSNTLSPAEWQELRAARMAAIKANPALVTKATQLQDKLRQFEQKLNAAMIKTDPTVAPVLAKFAANRPPPSHVPTPSPAKNP
jgi:hypothetical protein